MTSLARLLDGIPVVADASDRDARFASPDQNQRVENLSAGVIQRYTGTWGTDWLLGGSGAQGVISVKDAAFGAKGDNTTDDTAAIQAAITAAGVGGTIYFPSGQYLLTGTLTLLGFQTLMGSGFFLGTGALPATQLRWNISGSTKGIQTDVSPTFRNLLFRGPGKTGNTCIGIQCGDGVNPAHPRFDSCQFYAWRTGVYLNPSYYGKFWFCEWNTCDSGMLLNGSYNVEFISPTFRCYDAGAGTGGTAVKMASACRNLKITGGSIEGYSSSGGIVMFSGGQLTCLGTYWESSLAGTAAFGIESSSLSNVSVNLLGCMVYLTESNRWLHMGSSTNVALHAVGNKFVCPNTSSTTPTAYVLPTSGNVTIHSDDWSDVQKGTYTNGLNSGPVANWHITAPSTLASFLSDYAFIGASLAPLVRTAAPASLNYTLHIADKTNWDPMQQAGIDGYLVLQDAHGYRMIGQHKIAAAPTIGTWRQGDVIWNSAPSINGNLGWICTAAGTPGTWAAFRTDIDGANGESLVSGQASELLTLATGATTTDTSANLLPAGSIIERVVVRVTTTITTAVSYTVGDPTSASRFSATGSAMAAGSTVIGQDHWSGAVTTLALGPSQASAAKVRITCNANPGAGAVRITVFYRLATAPTS